MQLVFPSIKRGIKDSKNMYIIGTTSEGNPDSIGIFEYDGKTLKKIYYDIMTLENGPGMFVIDGHIYFAFREKIYKYINNQFVVVKNLSGNNIMHLAQISGRSENDLFFDLNGGIGHYNGTDVKKVFSYSNTTNLSSSLFLEKDCYFLTFDVITKLYILIHGKLK
jgi:hypothetical protein